jgi:2-polyprenyl-3-methyl-5-hydroxy-6-metoxy-1,4-benzoquinol methylase
LSTRFDFGRNWRAFLETPVHARTGIAEDFLKEMLDRKDLKGLSFLDIGSGSGLHSLAARALGAKVRSFDCDPNSVGCTAELKRRYFEEDDQWVVEQGSILDDSYISSLGKYDIVYAWGVLHHTGSMWKAIENAAHLTRNGGLIYLAIYNDQGIVSHLWRFVKILYNKLPSSLRGFILVPAFFRLWGPTFAKDLLRYRTLKTWKGYSVQRGMSPWHDVVDWVGGYPFEVAKPKEVINFMDSLGLSLKRSRTCVKGRGCNEFVFVNRMASRTT